MFQNLKGYRTYLFAMLIGLMAAFEYLGVISMETRDLLLGLFGMGGLASLRAAVK